MQTKFFRNNEIIFQEGDLGNEFYLIQSGQVELSKTIHSSKYSIDILDKGAIFGEFSVLDNQKRSATAIALKPLELLAIRQEIFDDISKKCPSWLRSLLKILAIRVRNSNLQLKVSSNKLYASAVAEFLVLNLKSKNASIPFHSFVEDCVNILGVSRKKVVACLNNFSKNKLIELRGTIIYTEKLLELSEYSVFLKYSVKQKSILLPSSDLIKILHHLPSVLKDNGSSENTINPVVLRSKLRSLTYLDIQTIDQIIEKLQINDLLISIQLADESKRKNVFFRYNLPLLKNFTKVNTLIYRYSQLEQP